jgi:hypothetical protein
MGPKKTLQIQIGRGFFFWQLRLFKQPFQSALSAELFSGLQQSIVNRH